MPEQPDDPIHYEMKIPPEPKEDEAEKDDGSRTSGEKDTDTGREKVKETRQPGG